MASNINDISNRTIFRVLGSIVLFVLAIYLAYKLRTQLIWIGTAFFLAVAINPLVDKIEQYVTRKRRGLAAGLAFVLVMTLIGVVLYLVAPPLVKQSRDLLLNLPEFVGRLEQTDNFVGSLVRQNDLLEKVENNQAQIARTVSDASVGILRGIFSGLLATLTILVLTFFMSLEGPTFAQTARRLRYVSENTARLASQCYKVVSGYVTGRLLMSLIAAVAAFIAMTIFNVPFAIPLALLVGLLDLVPLVGATMGALIVVLMALLFQSVEVSIVMAIFFFIYQQFENNVLQPVIDSKTVQLSPLAVFMSAIIGVSLLGLLGALVAIPVTGCLQLIAKDYYRRQNS